MSVSLDMQALVAEAAGLFDLSPTELVIVCLASEGNDPATISRLRGVRACTTKKQIQAICYKVGAKSLAHAAILVLRLALLKSCDRAQVRLAS